MTEYFINYKKIYHDVDSKSSRFKNATPFPYIVIDDFLEPERYLTLASDFPPAGDYLWKRPTNKHTVEKSVTKKGRFGSKDYLYPVSFRNLIWELHSSTFLLFLEGLTGILGLLPDPYLAEGGLHSTARNGFLDIHADFSHSDKTGLERRLNLIFYLNANWKPTYGGNLGLYDKDCNECESIMPIANRVVIFETSEYSFHGHPEPLSCPEEVSRKSLALYYYTMPRAERKRSRILFPRNPEFVHKSPDS